MSSLPLLPPRTPDNDNDKLRLIGIACLASEGESIRGGHEVEYFTLDTKPQASWP